MRDRENEERQQRGAIAVLVTLAAAFGVLWLLGFGWATGFALGFGGTSLGMALAYPTPRLLRPGLPRIALLVAAIAALLAGTFTGVAGFTGPSEMFFWGLGFGFLLGAVRGTVS